MGNGLERCGAMWDVLEWFGTFYKRVMNDPRMAVLFDTREKHVNVSAATHGKRLAFAVFSVYSNEYAQKYLQLDGRQPGKHSGRSMIFQHLEESHQRAKHCPMRSLRLRGKGFTVSQRNSWLGHLWLAGKDCNIPISQRDGVVLHLATLIGMYGPFVNE